MSPALLRPTPPPRVGPSVNLRGRSGLACSDPPDPSDRFVFSPDKPSERVRVNVHVLMRDEEASKVKQTTKPSNTFT